MTLDNKTVQVLVASGSYVIIGVMSSVALVVAGFKDNFVGILSFLFCAIFASLTLSGLVGQLIVSKVDLYHPQVRVPALLAYLLFFIGSISFIF